MQLQKAGLLVLDIEHFLGRNVFETHHIVGLAADEAHLLTADLEHCLLVELLDVKLALKVDQLVHFEC